MIDVPEDTDRITPFYDGKIIFITGGTGFLGKVLIEKFLRCMPKLGGIWLLVRNKKGKDPEDRLIDMFNNAVGFLNLLISLFLMISFFVSVI